MDAGVDAECGSEIADGCRWMQKWMQSGEARLQEWDVDGRCRVWMQSVDAGCRMRMDGVDASYGSEIADG